MKLRAIFVFALLVATGGVAHADDARSVVVTIDGGGDEAAPLEATIRELLGRVGLNVTRTATDPALARATVDLSDKAVAHVTVRGKDGREILRRDVLRTGTSAITREAIAHEVQTAVESELIVDEEPAAPRTSPPATSPPATSSPPAPPAPPPVATTATESAPPPPRDTAEGARADAEPFALDIATFAGGGPVTSDSGLVPRIGGAIAVATPTGRRRALTVSAAYALPFEQNASFVTARTSFVALRAIPSIELYHARWSLDVGVGGGIDVLSVRPLSDDLPTSALGPSTTHVDFIASALVTQRLTLTPGLHAFLSLGADVDLVTRGYVVARGESREPVLRPWRVRPVLALGLAFTAFGSGR